MTASSPDPQWPRRMGERHAELLRQVADLTAEVEQLRTITEAARDTRFPDGEVYVSFEMYDHALTLCIEAETERDALRRQVDAVDELCERARKVAGGVFVATLSSTPDPQDDRYVIVTVPTPRGEIRWRVAREPLAIPAPGKATGGEPQRTGTPPQPAQEPRTPAPGSPGTPETLSVPLSAPEEAP